MEIEKESDYFLMIFVMIAKKYHLSIYDTYQYLRKYKGVEFLEEFYDVEHTLNSDDVVDDLIAICGQNGGTLV